MRYTVFEYLNLSAEDKLTYFMETRSELSQLASYWVNFENVKKNFSKYDIPKLYMFDYLVGKERDEIEAFFKEEPELLMFIPYLLGIREDKFDKASGIKNRILKVQDSHGEYSLDFGNIQVENLSKYLKFVNDSGLIWALSQGLNKSIHDYSIGVEAGMDSNGRKNRSGRSGEEFLSVVLREIATNKGWLTLDQTSAAAIKEHYGIEVGSEFSNRRFDGSLFNPSRQKLYLFEVNNFNSSGSKSKASATEFQDLHERFSRTNHEFIYITDGRGWDSDKSHLLEAMQYIGKVFNYKMIEDGYLDEYLG
ncbi:DpnII family type II restriction endonuclease [Erysipelothrix rhusiopathiae]|nr:DpnII family type II restriction endonuclease [Erysipelothrix rhusiopathiae]MDE8079916.1 DpnII family type II restriction endonuclease [Erysipelothrix rhusiopathiae]MDE8084936.1 DpnII family type II restriction endonuclease [Erysipelothrix rhusiopathiae]MDE8088486.1 DpnII family type II restriction endonuclease [Erysipelothrix rhusiopathiae]MDE8095250.1 DpnII family type II restriction endonuclease [Erysipelothrix rhusiopathiae]